jgi:thiazole/oxazole-forming peptide maturase SagC family component
MNLLQEMIAKRLLITADSDYDMSEEESNEDVFYWTADSTRSDVLKAISDLQIAIIGINKISQKINQSLHSMGVTGLSMIDDPALRNLEFYDDQGQILPEAFGCGEVIADAQEFLDNSTGETRCVIATSEFGGQSFLLPWNEECVRRKKHFMPVWLKDMIGYVGPHVLPEESACLQCLFTRQNAHLHNPELLRQMDAQMQRGQSIAAIHPAMLSIVSETAVFELCHFYGGLPQLRPGRLVTINLPAGRTESKQVLKIPRCPICSPLVTRASVQIRKLTALPD